MFYTASALIIICIYKYIMMKYEPCPLGHICTIIVIDVVITITKHY